MFEKHVAPARQCSSSVWNRILSLLQNVAVLALMGGLMLGCGSVERAVDAGMEAAGQAAGERVGAAIGSQLAARVNLPTAGTAQWNQFMASQAQVFFSHAVSAGGYWPGNVGYAPGEWTRFQMKSGEGDGTQYEFERAFLTVEDNNRWWRVAAQYDEGSWIYEALIDTTNQQMVRLRAEDPDGNVGEIPVTERTVYTSPQELTEESLEGATTGTEDVTVPAGTFTADRIEYSGMSSGTVTWWMTEDVPGGIVRYQVSQDGEVVWTSQLVDYGTGQLRSSSRTDWAVGRGNVGMWERGNVSRFRRAFASTVVEVPPVIATSQSGG